MLSFLLMLTASPNLLCQRPLRAAWIFFIFLVVSLLLEAHLTFSDVISCY